MDVFCRVMLFVELSTGTKLVSEDFSSLWWRGGVGCSLDIATIVRNLKDCNKKVSNFLFIPKGKGNKKVPGKS